MPAGLIALALGGFGIGLTEFVIAGLLPEVAADFHVDAAAAGWLISGYALAVAVGAIGLTAAVTRLPRKTVLLGLMVLFILGNAMSAVATSYPTMLAGRLVAALCHGAFFGIGSVVAASMVDPSRKARAIAIMFTGLTAANVLGVPFGTLLGQQFGWRSTFWAITVVGVVALLGVAVLVPRTSASTAEAAGLRTELRAFRSGQLWMSLAATVLGFGGMFGAFTYIAYTLTGLSGFPAAAVPWLLILFGLGLFAGNAVGGRFADRSIDGTLLVVLAVLAAILGAFALLAAQPVAAVVALVLMGAFGFATVPGLQLRVLRSADAAPTLASGANIAAFNVGNALGAWLGGLTIAAGLGYASPLWVGAAMTVAAFVVVALAAAGRAGLFRSGRRASTVSDVSNGIPTIGG
jgi:DHA1 family inner membrane transport protein